MGVLNWPLQLTSMDDQRSLDFDAMVDTGASYTIVPARLLRELGVEPIDKIALALADGQPVEMDLGQATATIDSRSIPTLVVFGRDNARHLLRAYTLQCPAPSRRPGALEAGAGHHRMGVSGRSC